MDSNDLTAEQCDKLREQIGPHRSYLRKLEQRMYALGWKQDDELFENVRKAFAATDTVWIKLHYRACDLRRAAQPTIGFSGDSP